MPWFPDAHRRADHRRARIGAIADQADAEWADVLDALRRERNDALRRGRFGYAIDCALWLMAGKATDR